VAVTSEWEKTRSKMSELEFVRTVDRDLVHRSALSELFLTDSRRVDQDGFVSAAQLPSSHAYYSDHTGPSPIDPLLLLECCRQAETHAVHAHFGAPESQKFVLASWSMELPGLASVRLEPGPLELAMTVATHDGQWRDGVLRALGYTIQLYVSEQHVGETRIQAGYLPTEVYEAMRERYRTSRLPSSEAFRADPAGEPVEPGRVGRNQPDNVVLLDPVHEPDSVRARLRVAGAHPSLFDHAQDHHPGMVLMEAGRQLSVLAAEEFGIAAADRCVVTGLDASFTSYAELDSPLTVSARRPTAEERQDEGTRLHTVFAQDGRTVAEASFTVTDGLVPRAGAAQ